MVDQACSQVFHNRQPKTQVLSVRLRPFKSRREEEKLDWVGGCPFEVAKPEEIFDVFRARGFTLQKMRAESGDLGCNEFIFNNH
jgi:hypothetical protein